MLSRGLWWLNNWLIYQFWLCTEFFPCIGIKRVFETKALAAQAGSWQLPAFSLFPISASITLHLTLLNFDCDWLVSTAISSTWQDKYCNALASYKAMDEAVEWPSHIQGFIQDFELGWGHDGRKMIVVCIIKHVCLLGGSGGMPAPPHPRKILGFRSSQIVIWDKLFKQHLLTHTYVQ